MIGTRNSVTMTVLFVDLAVNALLTSLFLVPLVRRSKLTPQVREVAVRNLIAATICFFSSIANMVALTVLHGHEVAWVCFASCSADICVNAVLAFWVTRPPTQSETGENSGSGWRAATRKMDADETILSRFDRKNSLRTGSRFSRDLYQLRGLHGDESDSSSVHVGHPYADSDSRSLPAVSIPVPSHTRNGSTVRLLPPLVPRSPSSTTAPRSPLGASEPSTPGFERPRKVSLSMSHAESRAYRNCEPLHDGKGPLDVNDSQSEPIWHNTQPSRGHVGSELLEEVERVLSARGATPPGRGRRLA